MKLAWNQIIISLLIGLIVGTYMSRTFLPDRFSQNPPPPPHHFEKMKEMVLHRFSKNLDLTKEQEDKILKILDTKHTKMKELRDQIEPRFEELHKSTRDQIRNILNDKQKEKFDKLHKNWMNKRQSGRQFHMHGPPPNDMNGMPFDPMMF